MSLKINRPRFAFLNSLGSKSYPNTVTMETTQFTPYEYFLFLSQLLFSIDAMSVPGILYVYTYPQLVSNIEPYTCRDAIEISRSCIYSKTCLKRPFKNKQNKGLKD